MYMCNGRLFFALHKTYVEHLESLDDERLCCYYPSSDTIALKVKRSDAILAENLRPSVKPVLARIGMAMGFERRGALEYR
jgi:hypothetical protein